MDKKNIGKKIKERRLSLGLTQKAVSEGCVTRNMLSLIESGAALPSLETIECIAERLGAPVAYFISDSADFFSFEKQSSIEKIKQLYKNAEYGLCMKLIDTLSYFDDELNYIYADSAFRYGKNAVISGSLSEAEHFLNLSIKKAEQTIYDTNEISASARLYLAVSHNIHSPLLELDIANYEKTYVNSHEYEFYKYISLDFDFEFTNPAFASHLSAKALLKKYKYQDAIEVLNQIEENKNEYYHAYVMFGVYNDLENTYKQLGDFENAYKYASKRINLIKIFGR